MITIVAPADFKPGRFGAIIDHHEIDRAFGSGRTLLAGEKSELGRGKEPQKDKRDRPDGKSKHEDSSSFRRSVLHRREKSDPPWLNGFAQGSRSACSHLLRPAQPPQTDAGIPFSDFISAFLGNADGKIEKDSPFLEGSV